MSEKQRIYNKPHESVIAIRMKKVRRGVFSALFRSGEISNKHVMFQHI